MLKALPQHISSLHALFPTLSHMALTPNGRRLSPLFSSWALRPVFLSTSALSYLPRALLSRVVSLMTGQSGAGAQVTTALVGSPESVVAALAMAREELERVRDVDEAALERYGDRMWVYWAAEGVDGWVTEEAVREIDEVLERVGGEEGRARRQRCSEGMPHAFVLNEGASAPDPPRRAGPGRRAVEPSGAAVVAEPVADSLFPRRAAHTTSLARKCAGWIVEDLNAAASTDEATKAAA